MKNADCFLNTVQKYSVLLVYDLVAFLYMKKIMTRSNKEISLFSYIHK